MLEFPVWSHPSYIVVFFLFGICVGSFLNVVIYRVPRGLSVNHPKRSFCPICKTDIPMSRNIPLFTWLIQRGKCAECGCSIPARYFWVELLNGLLWVACWYAFSNPSEALMYMALSTLALIITAVDLELMLIPRIFTLLWFVVAMAGAALMPYRFDLTTWHESLLYAAFGAAIGWAGLWMVVLLGKKLFGKIEFKFEDPVEWYLREPTSDDEEISFVIDGEQTPWSDIFFRKSDKLIIDGLTEVRMDGILRTATKLEIHDHFVMLDTDRYEIENLDSLNGRTTSAIVPREAMGMGDVDLLAVLGATFGAPALLVIVLFSCLFAIIIALLGKIGFSKMIPFGPSLIAGGIFYLIYGKETWAWYMGFFGL